MLLTKVKKTIQKYSLLSPGDRVLVAVSGGPDSVCLLAALHGLSADLGISLHIAHLDHMFRGKESADEAQFVDSLAKKLAIPSTIGKIDVPAFCRERGVSPQAGARQVRYGFLQRAAEMTGAARIATGHTATDQAETFLMRLMRGAGASGLSAIPPIRENIIRPLIEVTREETLKHLRSNNLAFVSDPSNAKPVYTRNRIRMDVLPVLERFNPRIVEALAHEAALLRDEDAALETHSALIASAIITKETDSIVIKRMEFNALQPALRRRLLRKSAGMAGMDPSGLSSIQIEEALMFMADAPTGRVMRLPHGLAIEREYANFVVGIAMEAEAFSHELMVPGLTTIPGLGMEVELALSSVTTTENGNTNYLWQAAFDYDRITPYLTLRNRRPGDWFCPSGMRGNRKKLQDFFVDEKVPRRQRDRIPLLCAGKNVLWVVGLRTDERFLPGPETAILLRVAVRELNRRIEN